MDRLLNLPLKLGFLPLAENSQLLGVERRESKRRSKIIIKLQE